jgi:hypothetical protein
LRYHLRVMAKPAAKRAKKPLPPDPAPVISGRYWIAAGMFLAMVVIPFSKLGDLLQKPTQPQDTNAAAWHAGAEDEVRITLITEDYLRLACESSSSIGDAHCEYKSETEAWQRDPSEPLDDNKKDIIQPYRTYPDNKLILVAGLWADPAVAMRLHSEPPYGVEEKKLSRFVADCKMKFIGRFSGEKLRWANGGPWIDQGPAWVARPEHCTIGVEE